MVLLTHFVGYLVPKVTLLFLPVFTGSPNHGLSYFQYFWRSLLFIDQLLLGVDNQKPLGAMKTWKFELRKLAKTVKGGTPT